MQIQNLIDGVWRNSDRTATVTDKFSLQTCGTLHLASTRDVAEAVRVADGSQRACRLSPTQRAQVLEHAALKLEQQRGELVDAMQREAGFPLADAQGELSRCQQTFRLAAQEALRLTGEVVPMAAAAGQEGRIGFTRRVPLGVVCAITPFNSPLNTVAHKVAPALAAGNAVILKPSAHVPTPANLLARALLDAGLPPGHISVLHGGADVVDALLDEQAIRFYAFTGSTEVGKIILRKTGLRRTQMELGSIAFTILDDDVDLARVLPKVVNAAYRKAGQVCTSIQVLLVHERIVDAVSRTLASQVAALPFGDPRDPTTMVGPMISEAAAQRLEARIEAAIGAGAQRLVGGSRHGAVLPPTLLARVPDTADVRCLEMFGPVMSIVPFATLDEACARVNATPYGLATGYFTRNLDHVFEAMDKLEVGGLHINETSSSRVDLMPYGGVKDSGFGHEGPRYAVLEMTEERIVTLRSSID
jgi:succinate-semialdehyde dehydrogenase/glutarate-semialdehyde dehydrogenase